MNPLVKPVFLKKIMALSALAVALLVAGGCQKSLQTDGAYRVRIPLDDGAGNYGLQTVTLRSVTDIHAMAGSVAVFQADGHIDVDIDAEGKGMSVKTNYGTTPSAQFANVDGVLIPSDFESLSLATAMYHFESIKNFYDLFNANISLKFPRLVLFNISEVQTRNGRQAYAQNNAAYSPSNDLFLVNPYKKADIPLAMNGGVLAHEYLHSVFAAIFRDSIQENMSLGKISAAEAKEDLNLLQFSSLDEWGSEQNATSKGYSSSAIFNPVKVQEDGQSVEYTADLRPTNKFVWAAINEGIADYYGYEYTHNPAWLIKSLPDQTFRDVSSDKYLTLTAVDLRQLLQRSLAVKEQGQRLDEHLLGAYFSHFLYLVSQAYGPDVARMKTLTFMQRYHDAFIRSYSKHFFGMGDLVKIYFDGEKLNESFCRQVQRLFSGELAEANFKCSATVSASAVTAVKTRAAP